MSRPFRILTRIAIWLASLILVTAIAAFFLLRSQWFQNYVREKIISYVETSTGGRVELKTFTFDWHTFTASARDFVIHGTEPPGNAPLFAAPSITLKLKLVSSLRKVMDLQYLGVDHPSANLLVFENGETNIPTPKITRKPDSKSGLETVVDLTIGKIDVNEGSLQFLDHKIPVNVHARNFNLGLSYNLAQKRYEGQIGLALDARYHAPLNAQIVIPLILQRDAITVSNARIQTFQSSVLLNTAIQNIASPQITLQASTHLALDELARVMGWPIHLDRTSPRSLDAEIALDSGRHGIIVRNASATLGATHIEASGGGTNVASFRASVSLNEIARLLDQVNLPAGSVQIAGTANLASPSYSVSGTIDAPDLSIKQSAIQNVRLTSSFQADFKLIQFKELSLHALGGEITGDAALTNLETLNATVALRNFNIQSIAQALKSEPLGYSGVISGEIKAHGPLNTPDVVSRITISPGRSGVPVSGDLLISYAGNTRIISINNSVVTLPHSRIDLTGEPGRRAELRFSSRDLRDLTPAIEMMSASQQMPIDLEGGAATVTLSELGPLQNPRLSGQVQLTKLALGGRSFDQLSAAFEASQSNFAVNNGILSRGGSHAQFAASVGLERWKPEPANSLRAEMNVQNGELADFLALAGETRIPAGGALTAAIHFTGTLANPQGAVDILVSHGRLYDDSFDRLQVLADLSDQLVTLKTLDLSAGAARLQLQGSFTHPRNDFESGRITAHLTSSQIELGQFKTFQTRRPGLAGIVSVKSDLSGEFKNKQFDLSSIETKVEAEHIRDNRQDYGDLTASAHTEGASVKIAAVSSFAGSNIQFHGTTLLTQDFSTTADLSINNLPLEKAGALATTEAIPARGILNGNAHLTGTIRDPHAILRLELSKASIYDEPIDRVEASVDYASSRVSLQSFRATTPAGQVELSGSFSHPSSSFASGQIDLHIQMPGIELQRLQHVRDRQPGLRGMLQVTGDVSAELRQESGTAKLLPVRADLSGGLRNLALDQHPLGGVTFEGHTQSNSLSLKLDSDFAKSSVHGTGDIQLQADYPATMNLAFANVTYSGISSLMNTASQADLDGLVEGSATLRGSLLNPSAATGELTLSRLQISAAKEVVLQNQDPVTLLLARNEVQIGSARIVGASTDINISGSAGLTGTSAINLTVNANTDLSVVKPFSPGAVSAGVVDLKSTVRGTLSQPVIDGRVDLKNASLQLSNWPNGIYKASGVILVNGSSAAIQSLTAESGGGKVNIDGVLAYSKGTLTYNIRANARQVRTRYSGASVTANAALTLSGGDKKGALNGTVTITRVGYGQQSDIGSILSASTKPPTPPTAETGFLSRIRMGVKVQTASDVQFQTSLAQQLSATADLTVLGSLADPGILGRINATGGTLVFFGNKYSVNRGSISFYDANTINPMLDIDLETTAQGVDVNLTLSGPIDNLKLTYRSDPPLKFDDIIALLAAGKTPPDPTVAVNQPAAPNQDAMQMGESAILGAAVTNPIASRLQRVFGISQFTIAPTFVSGTALPQARVTLQQQVNSAVTFTYSQDLSQTNSQLIRVEWELTPRFSAVATRDENGIFGVDFFYKKQFR